MIARTDDYTTRAGRSQNINRFSPKRNSMLQVLQVIHATSLVPRDTDHPGTISRRPGPPRFASIPLLHQLLSFSTPKRKGGSLRHPLLLTVL